MISRQLLPCFLFFASGLALSSQETKPAAPPWTGLLQEFARPADELVLTSGKKVLIAPLFEYPGNASGGLPETLQCEVQGKAREILKLTRVDIQAIHFFENRALEKVALLLKDTKNPADLRGAEQLLQAVLRAHQGQRSQPPLISNPWADLQGRLADKLLEVRRDYLDVLAREAASEADWKEALELAERWLAQSPSATSLREPVQALLTRYGETRLKEGDLAGVRAALNRLDGHFLHSPRAEPLRAALRSRAESLAKEARDLPDDGASAKLKEGLALWPGLPGLRDELEKRRKNFQVLRVAVRHLPERLSPATAWTDSEKQVLELLFEGLVQVRFDRALGQQYHPRLARHLPAAEGLSRRFELARDAYWSDGERLSAVDVRHAALLWSQSGQASAWRDLVEVPRFEGDPFRLTFTQRQGFLDPLAPLTFKVLPQHFQGKPLARVDDPDFAKAPVGSGPFQFVGRKKEGQRLEAVFGTNPHFERKDGPWSKSIREIRLFAWKDAADLGQPLPHLVLDAETGQLEALRKLGYSDVRSLPSRRVYFLAANHRVPALANQAVRRALMHAIDREQILTEAFRGSKSKGETQKLHASLGGPYPVKCWAWCPPPRVPEDPHQPELARSFAKKAAKELGKIRLTLKYPADAPGVKEACAAVAEQVGKVLAEAKADIDLQLMPLTPQQMRAAIQQRDFELAYHHWDFADDNFWLWPVFDPDPEATKPGGSNYLGYDNDAKLQSLLRAAMSTRQFAGLKELHHAIHAHIHEQAPFIPLWQLHAHIAVHPSLDPGDLDPQQVFANVLQWKLK